MRIVDWLHALAPFAIPLGVFLGWLSCVGKHWTNRCPATAWHANPPAVCSCRCKACRRGRHEDARVAR